MNILLSNDDGYQAPGLNRLREALQRHHHVMTVAPDRDRSGASHSLTLDQPLRLIKHGENNYSVNGTPTDCVHLGLTGLYDKAPDLVISGINAGPNLGDDVIYSGTVAAAMEGRHLGYPAIAVSLNAKDSQYLDTAVQAVLYLLTRLQPHLDETRLILNVNIPNCAWDAVKGFQVTRLGQRHCSEPVIRTQDPRGREIFWVGPAGAAADAGEGTDFYAVQHNFISVTPIHSDLTRYQALDTTRRWLEAV